MRTINSISTPISSVLLAILLLWTSCTAAKRPSTQDAPVAAGDTLLTQREQIFNEVREGNTAKALALLEKTKPQDALLLKAQFEQAHKDFSRGLIDFDDFAITLARIHFAIVEWAPGETTQATVATTSKNQVRELAEAGELEEALHLLLPAMEEDAILMLARLHSTEKCYQQGLIPEDQLDQLKLKLKFAILEMVE